MQHRVEGGELNDPGFWRAQLGQRVSLRLRNPGDDADPFTEAAGVVASVSTDAGGDAVIRVVTRRGEERRGRVTDILAAKLL